ncbi:MAG: glycoside hydrolase family 26 protein [Clostridiales bacterium]|nr:glycoside hydrolase family 26 protein [Clostridiales bacterium]
MYRQRTMIQAMVIPVAVMMAIATFSGAPRAAYGSALYTLSDAGAYDLFTNHVDGYSLSVDKGMSVHMPYPGLCAVLEGEGRRIEIYKQDTRGVGKASYLNYSNRFLDNRADHRLEFSIRSKRLGKFNAAVIAWSRDKLARVAEDKNYYVCMELPGSPYVYTIFLKADTPVFEPEDYEYLARSFSVFKPGALPPSVEKTKPVDLEARDWNEETAEFYAAAFGPEAPLTWGFFEPRSNWLDYSRLEFYEETFGYEFPILLDYTHFQNKTGHTGLRQKLTLARDRGKVLELTLQTSDNGDEEGNMVYDVLNGEYDAFLKDYAEAVADSGCPVLFRLGNEMNGDWCAYSAYHTSKDTQIFIAFYRYVYGFFEAAGARNVIWVWNPNGRSYPDFKWNNELMYYPGDAYVDVVGLTAYNTGTYYQAVGERWQEFDELYDGLYSRYLRLFGQPLMITEFASASMGGDKEKWVADMFEHIRGMDMIKAAVWWNSRDYDGEGNVSRSYIVDETPELMDIFRKYLSAS